MSQVAANQTDCSTNFRLGPMDRFPRVQDTLSKHSIVPPRLMVLLNEERRLTTEILSNTLWFYEMRARFVRPQY